MTNLNTPITLKEADSFKVAEYYANFNEGYCTISINFLKGEETVDTKTKSFYGIKSNEINTEYLATESLYEIAAREFNLDANITDIADVIYTEPVPEIIPEPIAEEITEE